MDIITLFLALIWLAVGVLVVQFVIKTGGTKVGVVAHWFGGIFVMFGLAIALIFIYANLSVEFGEKFNVYMATHMVKQENTGTVVRLPTTGNTVTVYRHASLNRQAMLVNGTLLIDETKTVHTSLWWMLWDDSYATTDS